MTQKSGPKISDHNPNHRALRTILNLRSETMLFKSNPLYYYSYICCVENMLPNMGKENGVGPYHRVSRRICRLPFRLHFRTLFLYFNLYFRFWSRKKDLAFAQFKQCYLVGRFQHVEVILQNHKRRLDSASSG